MKVVSDSSKNLLGMERLDSREFLLTLDCAMAFSVFICSKWSAEWINELISIKKFQLGPCYPYTRLKGFQHCLLLVKGSLFVFAVLEGNSDGYEAGGIQLYKPQIFYLLSIYLTFKNCHKNKHLNNVQMLKDSKCKFFLKNLRKK